MQEKPFHSFGVGEGPRLSGGKGEVGSLEGPGVKGGSQLHSAVFYERGACGEHPSPETAWPLSLSLRREHEALRWQV